MKKTKLLGLTLLCTATILGGTSVYAAMQKTDNQTALNLSEVEGTALEDASHITIEVASKALELTAEEMKALGIVMEDISNAEMTSTTEGAPINDTDGTVADTIQITELTEDELKQLEESVEGLDSVMIEGDTSVTAEGMIQE